MTAALADNETLLTTSQVAHILGCHPSACVRWIQKGTLLSDGVRLKLEALATPGGWRVRREWLDAFLERITVDRAGTPNTTPETPKSIPKSERVARMHAGLAAAGF
jgi:hypothetical protein